jgi:hypothetical protein
MDSGRLREFVSAHCDVGEALFVPRRDFRKAFKDWRGGRAAPKGLPEAMDALDYKQSTRPCGPNRKNTGVYLGVRLRQQPIVEVEPAGPEDAATEEPAEEAAIAVVDNERDVFLENHLFGEEFSGARIRKTADTPPKISIHDLVGVVTGNHNPRKTWSYLARRFEDDGVPWRYDFAKFAGQGQTETPVTDARGMVIIINALGGTRAAKFRQKFADTLVRYLGGDETLIAEIRSIRQAQEQLPDGHPLRLFGQTVEAERAPERDDADEVQRALKRQKVHNELAQAIQRGKQIEADDEAEAARHDAEISTIRLQDCEQTVEAKRRILEILSTGTGSAMPPALTGMLSAARHNLASQALAQVAALSEDVAFGSQGGPLAIQAAPAPVATAKRVTVQEVGRDVLRLRPRDMTSAQLFKVGHAVAARWLNTPGNGSLDQKSQDQWERTYKDGPVVKRESVREVTPDMLATHRIKFSQAYLGANEVGMGQAFDVWTYPACQAQEMIQRAFESVRESE